ncbi:MAG: hypothetical protein IID45_15540, partial [Planctomycetes bacterium]|nr:hypothetical protein [Planctomycetota bacterium]
MKRSFRLSLSVAVIATAVSATAIQAQDSADGITVRASRISESRNKRLLSSKSKFFFKGSLSIYLQFKGEPIKKLTRIGQWKITTAKDDQGTDLRKRSSFGSKTRSRISRRFNRLAKVQPPQDEYESPYSLNVPARNAKSITSYIGEVRLSLSETDSVSIPVANLKAMQGKIIADPLLKKAGIIVTLTRVSQSTFSTSVSVKFTGQKADREKFLRLRFEDKGGKTIGKTNPYAGFRSGSGSGNGSVYSFRKMPDGAFLKFDIETKRTDVT